MGLLTREDFVRRLARRTRCWEVVAQKGDSYELRSNDTRAVRRLTVRHRQGVGYVLFQAGFPVSFPLDRTPPGIFARVLLRNVCLKLCHWNMDLQGGLESWLYLCGQWPESSMTPEFFDAVCHEMTAEIQAFHQELRDKFQGDLTVPTRPASAGTASSIDIRFVGPVQGGLPDAGRPGQLRRF